MMQFVEELKMLSGIIPNIDYEVVKKNEEKVYPASSKEYGASVEQIADMVKKAIGINVFTHKDLRHPIVKAFVKRAI